MSPKHESAPDGARVDDTSESAEEPEVVVRDRRRIDPETGENRSPATGEEPGAGEAGGKPSGRHAAPEPDIPDELPVEDLAGAPAGAAAGAPGTVDGNELEEVRRQLGERTADLQRLTAEYANYRKRVDRDRELVAANAKAQVAGELLTVLDDVERAEAHGDLNGAFKAVADKLVAVLQKAGLQSFGHEGEPFDPSVHEAVQHGTSPDVEGPTVSAVLRRGYRFGDRVIRPALVAVTDHEPGAAGDEAAGSAASTRETTETAGAGEATEGGGAPGSAEPPTAEAPGETSGDQQD